MQKDLFFSYKIVYKLVFSVNISNMIYRQIPGKNDKRSLASACFDMSYFVRSIHKPCPFGLGLKKFALDPVVVIFFKKCQKIYKCWIKCISKKFTTTGSANTCKFFWK